MLSLYPLDYKKYALTTIVKITIAMLIVIFYGFTKQSSVNSDFEVYLQDNRYDKTISNLVSGSSNFHYYRYLGIYYIDRDKKGVIDYKFVDEGIDNLYPNKNESGFLCLNLENTIYQNLKKYKPGQIQFNTSETQLISLIKYVKQKLPNVKVGIYGVPSNFYWVNIDKDVPNKFENLLNEVDYISPQLYIYYTKDQYGLENNIKYIKQNLEVSLNYAKKLKKPVIPYVWYLVHPTNKKYGNEIIPQDEMKTYLETIINYEFANQKAKGIIWWEPAKLDYKMPQEYKTTNKPIYTINTIVSQYLSFLINLKK